MIEFPAVAPGEEMVVSATSFVTFEQCPERANARFHGEYGPASRASFVGGLAHRLFARHLQGSPVGETELQEACRAEIGGNPSLNMRMGELGMKPSTLAGVIEEVGALYQRFQAMPDDGFEGAEVGIEASPAAGVLLKGSIDAVFDDGPTGVRLVDWKTGEVGDQADLQLDFYALVWALDRRELPGAVEAVSVKTGERRRSVPTRAGIEATAGRVADMVTRLRTAWAGSGDLERSGGPWCRFCPLLDDCPEGRSAAALLG